MARPKGSKNNSKSDITEFNQNDINPVNIKALELKENRTSLEHEIINQTKNAQRRMRDGNAPKIAHLIKNYDNEEVKGEQYSKCKTCGKIFEQILPEGRNIYTNYKLCPECRKRKSKKQEENAKKVQYSASLPFQPFPWQIEAMEAFENHRFIVLACGNRCLFKGAFVNGADKLIEDLKIDDKVINQNGVEQLITNIWQEPYNDDVYTIKAYGILPIRCTKNHPILICSGKQKDIVAEKFIEAQNLKKYMENNSQYKFYLKMPKIKGSIDCNKKNDIPFNETYLMLMGLFFVFGKEKHDSLKRCFLKFNPQYSKEFISDYLNELLGCIGIVDIKYNKARNEWSFLKNAFFEKISEIIGCYDNKMIPKEVLYNSDIKVLEYFMKGIYILNVKAKARKPEQLLLKNLTIIQQLQTAWLRLGFFSSIYKENRAKEDVKHENFNAQLNVSLNGLNYLFNSGLTTRMSNIITTENAVYTPLEYSYSEYSNELIYGISTQDETFVSHNVINHNSGKDRMTIMTGIKYFAECLNENRQIDNPDIVPSVYWWQLAPTEKMAKQNWRELKKFFPKEWIVAVSDSNYQMETIGGGIIEVRSGYDPEALVGVGLDLVTITEAARFIDLRTAWANLEIRLGSPGRGRKIDRMGAKYGQGKAIINSSPLGKNDFYDLYCYGQPNHDSYSSDWWSAKYPWTCNPINESLANQIKQTKYGEMTYEEILRRQVGERTFRSNYLADFLADDSSVFRNFEENCVINLYSNEIATTQEERKEFRKKWREPQFNAVYVAGYDPATGSSSDSPAFVIREVETGNVVQIYDLYGKNYEEQYDFIADKCKTYNYAEIRWLRTGHTAVEGQFEKRGIREVPINEQGSKKGALVQTLELAVENGDIHVLNDGTDEVQTLIFQMNDYTEKKGKYSNNKAPHDDFVSALYAAFSDYSFSEIPTTYCGLMDSF